MTIVNGLWVGKLGELQLLSIKSFLKQGHVYKLWIYVDLENRDLVPDNVPNGVEICDANDILDSKYIFKHWSGNYATFADIFRYKLLYERGGWWVDLDLVCLKRLPNVDYFYGGERTKKTGAYKRNYSHSFWIGLMKFPKGDKILQTLYLDMFSKMKDFVIESKKLPFMYGQTQLGLMLKKKLGDNFIHNQYLDVDLFNPFSYFDMLDFFKSGDIDKCCNRWGWADMDVNSILDNAYTIHLFNTILKELEEKRGIRCKLLEKLKKII